jgi:hypothetical protein
MRQHLQHMHANTVLIVLICWDASKHELTLVDPTIRVGGFIQLPDKDWKLSSTQALKASMQQAKAAAW